MRWFGRGQPARERTNSRPRVASAGLAASAAQAEAPSMAPAMMTGGLGSALAGAAIYIIPEMGAAGLVSAEARGSRSSATPAGLAGAALAAARSAGRAPEEVWREALGEWLLAREHAAVGMPVSSLATARRQREWGEIEAVARALRAS